MEQGRLLNRREAAAGRWGRKKRGFLCLAGSVLEKLLSAGCAPRSAGELLWMGRARGDCAERIRANIKCSVKRRRTGRERIF